MEQVFLFVDQIQSKAKRKGILLEDLFKEYDKTNMGTIPVEKFRNLLANINHFVVDEQFEFIITPFSDKGLFYYKLFLNDIANARETKHLSKSNESYLRKLGSDLKNKGSSVLECFRIYDRLRCGRVGSEIFLRELGNTPITLALSSDYTNQASGEIEYLKLHEDIEKVLSTKPESNKATKPSQYPPYYSSLARIIKSSGVSIRNYLGKSDKYKKSLITSAIFLSDLSNIGVNLSPNEMNDLANTFMVDGMVDYGTFCDVIEDLMDKISLGNKKIESILTYSQIRDKLCEVLKNRQLQIRESLAFLDTNSTGMLSISRFFKIMQTNGIQLTSNESSIIESEFGDKSGNINYHDFLDDLFPPSKPVMKTEDILNRLCDFLEHNRIQLRPRLSKYSNRETDNITFSQLSAVLRVIGFDMTPNESHILKTSIGRGVDSSISIQSLCDMVDPVFNEKKDREKLPPLPKFDRDQGATKALEAMTRVAYICDKYQFDIQSRFRLYDKKLNGLIDQSSFRAVFCQLPIQITKEEVDILTSFFASSSSLISYPQFCQDIRDFGKRRIDQSPKLAESIISETTPNPNAIEPLLERISNFLCTNGVQLKPLFAQYDVSNNGKISRSKFIQILENIGLPMNAGEATMLVELLSDDKTSDKVNYLLFLDNMSTSILESNQSHNITQADEKTMIFIGNMREKLLARHKKVRAPFSGYQNVPISSSDFRKCIESFGIIMKEPDVQSLLRFYKCNSKGDIDWNRFCLDVENSNSLR